MWIFRKKHQTSVDLSIRRRSIQHNVEPWVELEATISKNRKTLRNCLLKIALRSSSRQPNHHSGEEEESQKHFVPEVTKACEHCKVETVYPDANQEM